MVRRWGLGRLVGLRIISFVLQGRWVSKCLLGLGMLCIVWQGGVWALAETPLTGKCIAIDVGHGGIDSGARYYGLSEKEINLSLAGRIGERLSAAGAEVIYTRTDDVDYYTRGKGGKRADLLRRIAIIKEASPSAFISIHCNASSVKNYRGAQVFYHPRCEDSKRLAELMQKALGAFPEGNHRRAQANTHVLLLSSLSSAGVLLEAGYLSNEAEARMLADESYQNRLADAVLASLVEYFGEKSE